MLGKPFRAGAVNALSCLKIKAPAREEPQA